MNGNDVANLLNYGKTNEQLSQITNANQIAGFVVLTQAAYDALPAGKLTDGKVYLIAEA